MLKKVLVFGESKDECHKLFLKVKFPATMDVQLRVCFPNMQTSFPESFCAAIVSFPETIDEAFVQQSF